jgi:hypothetical protein
LGPKKKNPNRKLVPPRNYPTIRELKTNSLNQRNIETTKKQNIYIAVTFFHEVDGPICHMIFHIMLPKFRKRNVLLARITKSHQIILMAHLTLKYKNTPSSYLKKCFESHYDDMDNGYG